MTTYHLLLAVFFTKSLAQEYVTFIEGHADSKIILSAPHGGSLIPEGSQAREAGCMGPEGCIYTFNCGEIDPTNCGVTTVKDLNTAELAIELREFLCDISVCPALVMNNLHRTRLDPNREINEAAFGVPEMEEAYNDYMGYLEEAQTSLKTRGLVLDLHGHGHAIQRAELGYLILASQLNNDDLDPSDSSIQRLYEDHQVSFEEMLRGETSLGGYMEAAGLAAIPTPLDPKPLNDAYFTGGYITRYYGSRYDSSTAPTDAIQIECSSDQRSDEERPEFVEALGGAVVDFVQQYY
ncbi:hypothetical protein CAPTEDRAFT_185278 [Capitella teleta]|uniref:N-formylglutamate amidohydrolase n=1 Tax=Capitella teleta TaxID=283909 RepID=R7TBE4_CAPTE|nr:hypothetical protein CAPTEDRAFT_185278 [Capitella teleta]|eukprot:ELT88334.1 hypothetical protein CAPTEDRAFT_185278 [Capitella teleta]